MIRPAEPLANGKSGAEPIFLEWFNIELASRCNLRCKWCSLDFDKPSVNMDEALLGKALDELLTTEWTIGEIALHNGGEALMHPRAHTRIIAPCATAAIGGKPHAPSAPTPMRTTGARANVSVHIPLRGGVMSPGALRFPVSIEWQHGRLTRATAPGKPPLEVATPPEFKHGIAGVWTPEDLLVGAAASCYAVTLLAVAERLRVPVHALHVDGTGVLARGEGGFGFTSVELRARVETDEADIPAAERAAEQAEQGCLVTAAIDVPVHVQVEVHASHQLAV